MSLLPPQVIRYIIIFARNAGPTRVTQPGIFVWAVSTCFHISSVCEIIIRMFERERTFIGQIAWCCRQVLAVTAPRLKVGERLQRARFSYPS